MELKVLPIPAIEPIKFNYEELKEELVQKVDEYRATVYTAEQIKSAKADRAKLNALKKSLNDERIRLEKEYMQPFTDFKDKVAELVAIVNEGVVAIDGQVKDYEDLQKKEKEAAIKAMFEEIVKPSYPWLDISLIWDEKWLNVSVKAKHIEAAFADVMAKIKQDMEMLSRLPEYAFEAQETYKHSLLVDNALWAVDNLKQMEEAKEAAQIAAEKPQNAQNEEVEGQMEIYMPEPEEPKTEASEALRQELCFRVYVTMEEAMKLSHFMKAEGIHFERI